MATTTDRYTSLTNSPLGAVTSRLGLPTPPVLERWEPGKPVVDGPVVLGGAQGGRLRNAAQRALQSIEAAVIDDPLTAQNERPAALVYDATGIDEPARLRSLYEFFHPLIYNLDRNGRVVVLAGVPGESAPEAAIAQRAIEGFTRSVAKEIGSKGSTAQLVRVADGGEGAIESTLRFLLSPRSAYVDGQVIEISAVKPDDLVLPGDWQEPLAGRVAAVTGAARGIGEAIARTLARDGAHVICIDIPQAGGDLTEVANRIGGSALQLDITEDAAPGRLADHVAERHGKLDILVHNAGITRDRTLGRMEPDEWDSVLAVNLLSQLRLNEPLLERELIGGGGRIVSVSSVSGIAGNRGQANYATTKAGVIGMIEALAPELAKRSATINAVAPGFIETKMTAAMPLATREAGRRTSSLLQGGQPVDVAETIAWMASPASAGVNGNVVRVCGQALIGA
jgi:3-oxoacyl-[acyl-carrier protein] reductase